MITTSMDERRCLLVDMNDETRVALCEALTALGWTVQAAKSGTRALAIAAWFKPTILILDLALEDIPAPEVVMLLRNSATSTLTVIGISSVVAPELLTLARRAGIATVVARPVTAAAVDEAVTSQLHA